MFLLLDGTNTEFRRSKFLCSVLFLFPGLKIPLTNFRF
ncbi:hypothetical protein LEP1GSC195_0725 [Leptospira wolbachii serovar Codice str. CDC]|uniref:Uncharacterized protein n=1 Tax=Leptospira wolbachii serovar Codice str. CDC TaxID=1218599 RepID=R8ZZ08_9LEPT|nr:hypothetical protein LEP1GSC195_0725 [Leptospira wolbachii serovar Codice str. CDC]